MIDSTGFEAQFELFQLSALHKVMKIAGVEPFSMLTQTSAKVEFQGIRQCLYSTVEGKGQFFDNATEKGTDGRLSLRIHGRHIVRLLEISEPVIARKIEFALYVQSLPGVLGFGKRSKEVVNPGKNRIIYPPGKGNGTVFFPLRNRRDFIVRCCSHQLFLYCLS
ncbi:MAG TPA: hypothetical protein ENJ30_05355 [Desulfobulbaceae bacterium]|nr:hypothetical protein [Desulfobulbaceae bacterium]